MSDQNLIDLALPIRVVPVDSTGALGTAGAVTIANGGNAVEGATTDAAVTTDANGTLSAKLRGLVRLNGEFTLQMDYVGGTNLIYLGRATPGTATSAAAWQIRKFTYDINNNPTVIAWAGGSTAFSSIYDNRAGLTYS